MMSLRVLRRQTAVVAFCEQSDYRRFALSNIEWEQLDQMYQFLEPLCDATNEMCKTKYPTMNNMIPMYMSLMKGLKGVSPLRKFHYIPISHLTSYHLLNP